MVALYRHEGKVQDGFTLIGFEKGELSLCKSSTQAIAGATLELVKKREDGWSRVRCGGDEGWAPTSYMREMPQKQASVAQISLSPEQTGNRVLCPCAH